MKSVQSASNEVTATVTPKVRVINPRKTPCSLPGATLSNRATYTIPPGWCAEVDTSDAQLRRMLAAGTLEKAPTYPEGDIRGLNPSDRLLRVLREADRDAPDGRTPERTEAWIRDLLDKYQGRLTYDPTARWSDSKGASGVGLVGVVWLGLRTGLDMDIANRFDLYRRFLSTLAAQYEEKHGRHSLGFSRPE